MEFLVCGDDGSRLARAHVLVHLKTKDGHIAECTYVPSSDQSADALGAVFEKEDVIFSSHVCQANHIGRCPAHMHDDYAGGAAGDLALHVFGIKTEGVVDIGQHRDSAQVYHGGDD